MLARLTRINGGSRQRERLRQEPTFASLEFEQKKRRTRRERFLSRLDGLLPWAALEAVIELHYPKPGRGRRPYPLAVMLRVHVVQVCYNLSDPGMEDLLYEAESARRFCGLSLAGAIPDESTILHFRHLLERRQLGDTLLAAINEQLEAQGLRLQARSLTPASSRRRPRPRTASAAGTRRCIKRARATSGTSG